LPFEWWVYRVLLPLSPLWSILLLLLVAGKGQKMLSVFKEGQLIFFSVALAAHTLAEYETRRLTHDLYYYFQFVAGVIASSFLYGVARMAVHYELPEVRRERVQAGIGWASFIIPVLVIRCSYNGLKGK